MLQTGSDVSVASSRLKVRGCCRTSVPARIIAVCLVGISVAVHYTDYGPLIPILLTDLHIAPGQAGLMSTLLFLGLATTYLPGGLLVERYGQRPVLLVATSLMVFGGIILPLWPNIYWILACRLLIGFGSGAAFIAGAGIVADVEKHAALVQGLYGGFIQVGSGLGLLVTPWLAGLVGWRGTFLCWGLLSLPALLAWFYVQTGQQTRPEKRVSVGAGLRSPAVWSLGLAHMGTFGVGNAIAAWTAVYLVQQYGLALGRAALFAASGVIAGAFIRPLGGLLLGRKVLGTVTILRVSTIVTCLGVGLLALPLRQPVLAIVGLAAVACGSTLPYTAIYQTAAQLRTVSKGVAQGLLSVIACQAILWGPPLIGLVFQMTGGFSLSFCVLLFFCDIAINASFLAHMAIKYEKRM